MTLESNALSARTLIEHETFVRGVVRSSRVEVVDGRQVCVVSCDRASAPILLKWKGVEKHPEGDFFYRRGPGTAALKPADANDFVAARFPTAEPLYST